jgi:hypothetical protein
MEDTIRHFSGYMPSTTNTDQFVVPSDRMFVLKSLIVTNTTDLDVTFTFSGRLPLAASRLIKARQTLIIPVADICYTTFDNIRLYASTANAVSYFLSGVEYDSSSPIYAGFRLMGAQHLSSTVNTIVVGSFPTQRLIKTVVLCNLTSSVQNVTMYIAGIPFISAYKLAPNETLFMPNIDQVLLANSSITANCSTNNAVFAFACGKAVV